MSVVAVLSLLSSPAAALSCIWGIHDANVEQDAIVPANSVFVVKHTFDASADVPIELRDENDQLIDVSVEVDYQSATVLPDDALPVGTYTLMATGDEGYLQVPFEVADQIDDKAPDAPVFRELRRDRDRSEWGLSEGIVVELDEVDEASHYELELAETADFSDPIRVVSMYPNAYLGDGLCIDSVPGYDHSVRYHVRARAVDIAGNASSWTDAEQAKGGCSTVSAPASLGGLGLALFALAGRRRR